MLTLHSVLPTNPLRGILETLFGFQRGHASFIVGDDDELRHDGTVVTVKMQPGESLEAFHVRMRRDHGLRKGDKIELLNNDGKVDTARLTLFH